ncbi:MAG: membrane protein insertion efficiency factor YidD [Gammaproteobacteria bacterium]|nr:membrane protein insertion efficiency factor YidD [Gammaproteobacteria bacterium]
MLSRMLRATVLLYRYTLSPLLGPRCRFSPTCSEYCLEALAVHGALKGGWLTIRRLLRCHPWGGAGYDPVPRR